MVISNMYFGLYIPINMIHVYMHMHISNEKNLNVEWYFVYRNPLPLSLMYMLYCMFAICNS